MAYTPTNWQTGDIITAEKLNNIEDGIVANEEAIGSSDVHVIHASVNVNQTMTIIDGSLTVTDGPTDDYADFPKYEIHLDVIMPASVTGAGDVHVLTAVLPLHSKQPLGSPLLQAGYKSVVFAGSLYNDTSAVLLFFQVENNYDETHNYWYIHLTNYLPTQD